MATYYIDPNGSDGNDGSSGSPWLTTNQAISGSTTGDTIILKDGTYTWTAADYPFNGVRTFEAENISEAILDGGGNDVSSTQTASVDGQTVIKGIVFRNGHNGTDSNNAIFDFPRNNDGSIDLVVQSCTFETITSAQAVTHGGGLFSVDAYGTWLGTAEFDSCIFDDIYHNPLDTSYNSCYLVSSDGTTATIKMYNCTVYMKQSGTDGLYGIAHGTGAVGSTFIAKNNIFYNDTGEVIWIGGRNGFDNVTFEHNCRYNMSGSRYGTNSYTGTGVITSDPLFIDKANGDFRIRQSSPCVDQGTII